MTSTGTITDSPQSKVRSSQSRVQSSESAVHGPQPGAQSPRPRATNAGSAPGTPDDGLGALDSIGGELQTRNLRVASIRSLLPPAYLLEELPLPKAGAVGVWRSRAEVVRVLNREDDRLIVIVGPCSVHDPAAGLDYACRLKGLADELADDLLVIMRLYFEKPRTTVGWKGLINDPHLDGSYASNDGLKIARGLLLDVVGLGLPVGCEFLDPISPQYISDAVTWGAIGARTCESQVHRTLASGLSMPVGFKNSTDGRIRIAIDAIRTAAHSHSFFGVTEQGLAGIVMTTGNADCHMVLRGSAGQPNHGAASVQKVLGALRESGLPERVIVDASHDNSGKDHTRQPLVAEDIAAQVAEGEAGIVGVMLESFLVDGRQDLLHKSGLVYGQSITDACMGWEMTVPVLHRLAAAARERREKRRAAETGDCARTQPPSVPTIRLTASANHAPAEV